MNTALKEWSAVIAALDHGSQIFLLRKGGIVEAKRGFEPRYAEFLLFPTFEHQHARHLKPGCSDLPGDRAAPPEGSVRISHLARVTDILQAPQSLPELLSLSDQHIWNEDFISQRIGYRPDLPLYVLVVRAYRLEQPEFIPQRPSYAGCKSWVHLIEEVSTAAVQPVLTEEEFARRRYEVLTRLSGGSERLKGGEETAK
jgi:hypothetical protein